MMMRVAVVSVLVVVASCAMVPDSVQLTLATPQLMVSTAQADPEFFEAAFTLWSRVHDQDFPHAAERELRLGNFKSNVAKISEHNAKDTTWKMALNQFAALTAEEFAAMHLGIAPGQVAKLQQRMVDSPFSHANISHTPDTVDWVKAGAVTHVKNQQMCGSCWAFSTTGSIEGINQIKTGKLISLSEQELVDCDTKVNMGCGGGLMDNAFEYVEKVGGLDSDRDYPYWGMGVSCDLIKQKRKRVSIDGHEDVPPNDERALRKAVSQQPVSVAICASELQFYGSGVVSSCCKELDHGVLAAGYGEDESGHKYWLVKNSWGVGWGEEGYFRLGRDIADKGGMCAIATAASYPIKTGPNPPAPSPVPETCDWFGLKVCPVNSACFCQLRLPVLDICLMFGCAAGSDNSI